MNHNTPYPSRILRPAASGGRRLVLTARQLREHGVTAATAAERCRPGGHWQQILPGVFLLHPGAPTSEERLHAALMYASRRPVSPADRMPPPRPVPPAAAAAAAQGSRAGGPVPEQPGRHRRPGTAAVISGLAALALHRFSAAPPLPALDRFDVLVPRSRRLRSAGHARITRTAFMPRPVEITGLPVAPVPRALADAVARLTDATTVRRLLTEAVRERHCEAPAVVQELSHARLLTRPYVIDAVDTLLAEGRAIAENRLYAMVRDQRLPEPLWNVELRLPEGPGLGGVDAYWPEQAVALRIDARPHRLDGGPAAPDAAPGRESFERLGITLVRTTPRRLRDAPAEQATVVRTALAAAADSEPASWVAVLPR